MNQRERKAIVRFWLWKRWGALDPQTFRRFFWRSYSRLFGSVVCLLFTAGLALAAETKPASTNLLKLLDSKAVAEKREKDKLDKEKQKRRLVLADPDPDLLKETGEVKSVEGTMVAKNNRGMAVEYDVTADGAAQEIWVNFHSKVKFEGVKDPTKLEDGDVVRVDYKLTKEGKMLLKAVRFVRRPPPPPAEAPEPAEEVQA